MQRQLRSLRVTLRNGEIADLFDLLGDLYELDGAVVYRVLAYRRAAKRFRETAESVWALSEQGRLTELDDIGDTIAAKVERAARDGHDGGAREAARRACPRASSRSCACPGLGAKTARRLWQELGITTLAELEAAAREGRLQGQAGFGERKEQQLLAQIEAGAGAAQAACSGSTRRSSSRARVLEPLRAHPACVRADEAGSLRRRAETVGDIDLIAASDDAPALTAWLIEQPFVAEVLGHGDDEGLDRDPQRRPARPARRAARELRQPPAALHRLEGPQRARCARTRSGAA